MGNLLQAETNQRKWKQESFPVHFLRSVDVTDVAYRLHIISTFHRAPESCGGSVETDPGRLSTSAPGRQTAEAEEAETLLVC